MGNSIWVCLYYFRISSSRLSVRKMRGSYHKKIRLQYIFIILFCVKNNVLIKSSITIIYEVCVFIHCQITDLSTFNICEKEKLIILVSSHKNWALRKFFIRTHSSYVLYVYIYHLIINYILVR